MQQHGLAQPVGEVRGQAGDQVGLGPGEAEWAVLAVQAQVAPALRAGDQRGAQLVAEAEAAQNFAVAGARRPVAAGRVVQRSDVRPRAGQRGEPVHVLAAELVVQEQRHRGAERVLGVCAGEQQRLGIGGRDEGGVDGNGPAEVPQHLALQPADVEAGVAVADHVTLGPRQASSPGHGPSVAPRARRRNPNLLGWSVRRTCRTLCR